MHLLATMHSITDRRQYDANSWSQSAKHGVTRNKQLTIYFMLSLACSATPLTMFKASTNTQKTFTLGVIVVVLETLTDCCCCCHHLAGKGRSVAPRWPRLTARLQRSAGGRLLSFRIWSTHLLPGRPARRCHWLLGGRPRDRLTWQLSALWAGTSSGSLATWPKRALRRRLMVSEMDGRLVVAAIASLRTNWCHLIGRQEIHLASKNSCFKIPWNGG